MPVVAHHGCLKAVLLGGAEREAQLVALEGAERNGEYVAFFLNEIYVVLIAVDPKVEKYFSGGGT